MGIQKTAKCCFVAFYTLLMTTVFISGCKSSSGGGDAPAPNPVLTIAPTTLPGGFVGTAYSQTLTASGGTAPYTFTCTTGSLPEGLTLATGGVLSGTPSAAGSIPFTITTTDAKGFTGSRAYTLAVTTPPTLTLAPSVLPGASVGVSYTQTLTASGGTPPYTFACTTGRLPDGLSLGADGVLSGSPTAVGTSAFTITATDANRFTGNQSYTFAVTSPSTLDLSIACAYITQATQKQDFSVPLVKDRDGYLRVFAVANQANTVAPQVRVRIYNAASEMLEAFTIAASGASVPTSVDESSLIKSWNLALPARLIQPGFKLLVDVDPTLSVAETRNDNNHWPLSGAPFALDVRTVSNFRVSFWAVQTGDGRVGDVNSTNMGTYTSLFEKLFPVSNATARTFSGTFTTSAQSLASDTTAGWSTCLSELNAKRVSDGASGYYYGVVNPSYTNGIAGLGYVGAPTALGWDKTSNGYGDGGHRSGVYAHETGHNLKLEHTGCGDPEDADPLYPYAGGLIGAWGMDTLALALKNPGQFNDIMGYCDSVWISDYHFKKALESRTTGGLPSHQVLQDAPRLNEKSLLLWGRLEGGTATLEPAFSIPTPAMPPEDGDCLMEGFNDAGERLFAVPFGLTATSLPGAGAPRHFAFSIPLAPEIVLQLSEIRWSKNGEQLAASHRLNPLADRAKRDSEAVRVQSTFDGRSRLTWDSVSYPMVMVRDVKSGEVLGFIRNGDAMLKGLDRGVEMVLSDGVQSWSVLERREEKGE